MLHVVTEGAGSVAEVLMDFCPFSFFRLVPAATTLDALQRYSLQHLSLGQARAGSSDQEVAREGSKEC